MEEEVADVVQHGPAGTRGAIVRIHVVEFLDRMAAVAADYQVVVPAVFFVAREEKRRLLPHFIRYGLVVAPPVHEGHAQVDTARGVVEQVVGQSRVLGPDRQDAGPVLPAGRQHALAVKIAVSRDAHGYPLHKAILRIVRAQAYHHRGGRLLRAPPGAKVRQSAAAAPAPADPASPPSR